MSQVQAANAQIPIAQACRWAQVEVPDEFSSRKTWCPFGLTHGDGGREAALRLYADTNTAHCFACGKSWSPVSLMAEYWDCGRAEAAEKMCLDAGISEPTWREAWEQLQQPSAPDQAALAEAAKTWCRRVRGPSWERDQFSPRFAEPLGAFLRLLPLVSTAREADEWFYGCKLVMEPILREAR